MEKPYAILAIITTPFIIAALLGMLAIDINFLSSASNFQPTASLNSLPTHKDVYTPVYTSPASRASLIFVGDIMLGRNVERLMLKETDDYPFVNVTDFFGTADIVAANLEGTIPRAHHPTLTGSTRFSFRGEVADTLARNHVNIVSLANNHTLDYGEPGFKNTVEELDASHLSYFGHQRRVDDLLVLKQEINRTPFVFMGLNDVFGILDRKAAISLASEIVERDDSFLVVSIHWGDEYQSVANSRQRSIARELIDAGADVIIGHHPHWVQDIDIYKNKLIFYSLGNFIFDQYFSEETQQGLAVKMIVREDEVTYELYPVDIPGSQPVVIVGEDKETWLIELARRSNEELKKQIEKGVLSIPR